MSKTPQKAAPLGESENSEESDALRARIQTLTDQKQADREFFISESELLRRLPVSRRTLYHWRATSRIPFLRLGGRRILFHWPSVEAALLRWQRGTR